jgi:hypothetical protein
LTLKFDYTPGAMGTVPLGSLDAVLSHEPSQASCAAAELTGEVQFTLVNPALPERHLLCGLVEASCTDTETGVELDVSASFGFTPVLIDVACEPDQYGFCRTSGLCTGPSGNGPRGFGD